MNEIEGAPASLLAFAVRSVWSSSLWSTSVSQSSFLAHVHPIAACASATSIALVFNLFHSSFTLTPNGPLSFPSTSNRTIERERASRIKQTTGSRFPSTAIFNRSQDIRRKSNLITSTRLGYTTTKLLL
jgi:hypothetical protein